MSAAVAPGVLATASRLLRRTLLLAALLTAALPPLLGDDAMATPLKVFLLAGQSNMVGKRSLAAELPPALRQEQPRALFFTAGGWVPLRPGVSEPAGFGPELAFAERMTDGLGESIGLVKFSVGGTNLAVQWSPQREDSLYAQLLRQVRAAAQTRPVQVVGMVWMQGGNDAKSLAMATAYRANLEALLRQVRQDTGNPDLKFVCGRSASPPDRFPHVALVRQAQTGIDAPGYAWVDCDPIAMGPDGVHYSTAGQVQAGYLFADAMLRLLRP